MSTATGVSASALSDSQIIASIKTGDLNNFEILYERHKMLLYHVCARILASHNGFDPEDAVQEAYLKALAHISTFNGEAKFSTWLTRIAMNECLMHLRNKSAQLTVNEDFLDCYEGRAIFSRKPTNNYEKSVFKQEVACVKKAIQRLSPLLQQTVRLYYLEECSIKEISQVTGSDKEAVKARILRSRMELLRLLKHLRAPARLRKPQVPRAEQ